MDGLDERGRHVRHPDGERLGLRLDDQPCGLVAGLPLERARAAQELVGHEAEGKDVTARVHRSASHLLRRHVARRADDVAHHRVLGVVVARDAEVEEPEEARITADDQVGRLDVAMDDPVAMRVLEAARQLVEPLDPARHGDGGAAADDRRQRVSGDVLHRHVGPAAVFADGIDRDDVGVLHAGREARLPQESLTHVLVVDVEHLDGDEAIQWRIVGEIHHAHAACAQALTNLERSDVRGKIRHGGSGP